MNLQRATLYYLCSFVVVFFQRLNKENYEETIKCNSVKFMNSKNIINVFEQMICLHLQKIMNEN